MKAAELMTRLLAEGCNEHDVCIGAAGLKSDVDCLEYVNGVWQVYYTERGIKSPPFFTSYSEEEAAQFYYDHQMQRTHTHMICFYKDEQNATAVQAQLDSLGIRWRRNDIPAYHTADDPRFRVYVFGKDIFRVRELFDSLPLYDE